MTLKSRRHDLGSIEPNVNTSWRLFIGDVARLRFSLAEMSSSANGDSWSINVHEGWTLASRLNIT